MFPMLKASESKMFFFCSPFSSTTSCKFSNSQQKGMVSRIHPLCKSMKKKIGLTSNAFK